MVPTSIFPIASSLKGPSAKSKINDKKMVFSMKNQQQQILPSCNFSHDGGDFQQGSLAERNQRGIKNLAIKILRVTSFLQCLVLLSTTTHLRC